MTSETILALSINQAITIILFVIAQTATIVGFFYKFSKKQSDNNKDVKQLRTEHDTLVVNFKAHEEITPNCFKKFDDIETNFKLINQSEDLKQRYMGEMVREILAPVVKEMNAQMVEYVNTKTGLMLREAEQMKEDNMAFKNDLKELFREFKDHTEKSIYRLVETQKQK